MAAIEGHWAYRPAYASARARRRRLQRRWRLLAVAVVLAAAVCVVPWAVRASSGPAAAPVLVTVQPGDTLWGIAGRYTSAGGDPRRLIYEISRINHLDDSAVLQPGQTLVVPGAAR